MVGISPLSAAGRDNGAASCALSADLLDTKSCSCLETEFWVSI